MPRYLLEVSQPEIVAAKRIDKAVRSHGSHFATQADWHRKHGVCTGTMVVEAENRATALAIVPPGMRTAAQVFQLQSVVAAIETSTAPAPTDGLTALAA